MSPKQKQFDMLLLNLVAKDGLPFDITNAEAFQKLVNFLNPMYTVKSRTTIRNLLDSKMKDINFNVSKDLDGVGKQCVHIIVDIWTSKDLQGVFGIKCQFIDRNYELKNKTIGFLSFNQEHTGFNIATETTNILKEKNVSLNQIGYIMADNASNMVKAYEGSIILYDDSEDEEEDNDSTVPINFEEEYANWNRLGCIAHTLQLAINDAIKKDFNASETKNYINAIMVFFHRHIKCMNDLKKEAGVGLPSVSKTRWNSLLFAVERMVNKVRILRLKLKYIKYRHETFLIVCFFNHRKKYFLPSKKSCCSVMPMAWKLLKFLLF